MNCECVEKLNTSARMIENNSYVHTASMMNMKSGTIREVINIPLAKRSSAKPRPKFKFITANFCPFCGMNQTIKGDVEPVQEGIA